MHMCYNSTKRELECICYTLIILLQFMVLTDNSINEPCTNVSENVMKDGILRGCIEIMEWTAHRNKPLPKFGSIKWNKSRHDTFFVTSLFHCGQYNKKVACFCSCCLITHLLYHASSICFSGELFTSLALHVGRILIL